MFGKSIVNPHRNKKSNKEGNHQACKYFAALCHRESRIPRKPEAGLNRCVQEVFRYTSFCNHKNDTVFRQLYNIKKHFVKV